MRLCNYKIPEDTFCATKFHKRTKHIKRRFNSIWDLVQVGDIEICKIHTDLNVADP